MEKNYVYFRKIDDRHNKKERLYEKVLPIKKIESYEYLVGILRKKKRKSRLMLIVLMIIK